MSASNEKWIDGLQFSSLFWPPPHDVQQKQAQILAYVEYFGQFTADSEQFPEDVAQLIQSCYPSKEKRLVDEVLATFVLHHPEHGHAVVHPILSRIIDGTLCYDRHGSPFSSFISLFSQTSEKEYSEQWALACGEILRVLTHYNRPIFKVERQNSEAECRHTSDEATSSDSSEKKSNNSPGNESDRKPLRPLSFWITDILLAAPLGIRSDYFRWCGGVMGKYAAGGELKPPTTAFSRGSGKHPQLMPSTPRWAVANGAGVILSVCDEEVARYETANLTAAAVPALLLPPPTTPLDEHLVAGLPPLEPYARLFHRYYAIATPSATQRLLFGLLEAPPSWAPDALDAAVQLVELLRAAEDYATGMRLPKNWMHLHFLRAIGTAMSMRAGIAADTAAALLFRILSQPTLLFPPLRHAEGVEVHHEPLGGYVSSYKRQLEVPASEATIDATAQGIASMLCAHGPDVEWRICTIWEAAYGLLPLSSSAVDLPEIVVAAPLQPPTLSWSLYLPLLKVFEYLPRGSPSEACLMRIFVATVEAILRRTFPTETSEQSRKPKSQSKNLAVAELRTMIHSLFVESCASMDLASRLLFVVLTVCVSHQALPGGSKRPTGSDNHSSEEISEDGRNRCKKKQGPVATFDSYVLAAVCALSCELQLFPFISKNGTHSNSKNGTHSNSKNGTHSNSKNGTHSNLKDSIKIIIPGKTNGISNELHNSISSAILHTRRILGILEALFSLKPSSVGTSWSYSSNEIVAAAMVAAHVSELFRRSRPCLNALSALKKCKWDAEISNRASSLYHLIDLHGKTVSSIVNKAEPLEVHLTLAPVKKDDQHHREENNSSSLDCGKMENENASTSHKKNGSARPLLKCADEVLLNGDVASTSGKAIASLQVEASDLANFLTMDRNGGYRGSQTLLRSVLSEKQELCFSVVSLLWQKLIASPEMQMSAESTSAHQGWRKVVDALCDVVSASPAKASTAIVLQAEKDLQPWIARDDEQGQKMWRVNQRIVKLIAELMRNHDSPEALVILASSSDLLLRATDGILVDGEACTLPQLELLEVTARAVHLIIKWGDSGVAVADGLSNLLKCRLSTTIRCLSHPSAHVRALSMSVLRDILNNGPTNSSTSSQGEHRNGMQSTSYQCLAASIINWQADVERCIEWEAHSRRATGLTLAFLGTAAKELGCPLPC
ncbi:protein GIGANTEA [Phragmites australis]|uniref:protein GIGANTEA n=1 Tax=Phragmites australis TaxID=29695 RepID=UPI002D77117F|nr:protein GIGANTEA [Phragmites australis]XP_062206580.1 protein GIGANTEA [Phragmites australis]XP_062206658.1 protein GIGANTEA [Phragmites australis]